MDGMDEWRFADMNFDADEARYEQQKKIERKNTYCNIIRDYRKLQEIAAIMINNMDIKDEDAETVKAPDILGLSVDDKNITVTILWLEYIPGESENSRVVDVPAEWFAADKDDIPGLVRIYKRQMEDLIEGLERDLKFAQEQERDVKNQIVELKNKIEKVRDSCGLWS